MAKHVADSKQTETYECNGSQAGSLYPYAVHDGHWAAKPFPCTDWLAGAGELLERQGRVTIRIKNRLVLGSYNDNAKTDFD